MPVNKEPSDIGTQQSENFNDKATQTVGDDYAKEQKEKAAGILAAYDPVYKNILWIDDMDDKTGDDKNNIISEINWMEKRLADKNAVNSIKLISNFADAVCEITRTDFQYDLVLFDMNLEEGICDGKKMTMKTAAKRMSDYHFSLDPNNIDTKTAGAWLYNLLLAVGYPFGRIRICTAYGTDTLKNEINNGTIKLDFNSITINKPDPDSKSKEDKLDLEEFFRDKDNEYYRVRRLVFQACDYWERKLDGELKKNADIPFNKIYGLDISSDSFKEMFTHIKMMFPVKEPSVPGKVYYEAARVVSMFHEESAKVQKLSDKCEFRCFHSAVRYFRNWSAHNKFKENSMEANSFALLFCVAMRTYFDGKKAENKPWEISKCDCEDYENSYFGEIPTKHINHSDCSNLMSGAFKDLLAHNSTFEMKCILEKDGAEYVLKPPQNADKFFREAAENKDIRVVFPCTEYVFLSVLNPENFDVGVKFKAAASGSKNKLCMTDPENVSVSPEFGSNKGCDLLEDTGTECDAPELFRLKAFDILSEKFNKTGISGKTKQMN